MKLRMISDYIICKAMTITGDELDDVHDFTMALIHHNLPGIVWNGLQVIADALA